ncbi:uncharacterized protein LOC142319228 isoform X2 [Lycorma delicatula]|uniref:uncharacterized protein LOC142319228 isoform X2 n=1 Tax=Lycorma delicatula TaxID=130591 RepID=UPI003F516608
MANVVTSLLASQFLEKLNDQNESLEQRISLADKFFCVRNLPFNRKEEVIFTWIVDMINSDISVREKKEIFCFLEKCLGNPQIQLDEVEIKPSVCNSLFEILQTWGLNSASCPVEVSRKCVVFVIKSQIFYYCFKKDVVVFSKLIVTYFNSVSETSSVEDCAFIVQRLIDLYNDTLLKKNLQLLFVEKVLLSIVNALVVLGEVNDSDFERKTYTCISKILFQDPVVASAYVTGLKDLEAVKETCTEAYILIQKLLKLPKKYSLEVVEYLYPKCLHSFASNTKDENKKFEVFVSLCGVIGFKPIQNCVSANLKTVKNFEGITVLLKMIKIMNKLNISADAEIDDVYFSSWLISLLQSFPNNVALTPDLLNVIREIILSLDPIVAEQMLPYFVKHVLLKKKLSDTLINVYYNTLVDIFNIFIKLSRIHVFLSKILLESIEILMHSADDNLSLEEVLPKKFCKKFSDAITAQPTVSFFHVVTTTQYCLQKFLLPKTQSSFSELDHGNGLLLVEMIFELTSQLLRGTWIADHTVPFAVREKFTFVLRDIAEFLRSFGMALVKNTLNNRATAAYFDLCCSWGAVNLMMIHYSYDKKDLIEPQTNNNATNLAYVLNFLPDITWDLLSNRIINFGDTEAKHSLFQLMEQKMSALRETEEGSEGPASLTARFLLENADDDWICSHANSLLPFFDAQELVSLATKLSRYKQHHKLIELFETEEFHESKDMVAAMGLTLLSDIARKSPASGKSLLKKVLSKLLLGLVLIDEADQVVSEEVKKNLCDLAVILSEGIKEDDYKSDFQISTFIQRKLELLSSLPLCYLQSQTQVVILITMLAAAKSLPYHVLVYDIITSIIDDHHPVQLPETICWPALLQWIAASSKDYPQRIILLRCLIKLAFRDIKAIGNIINSLSLVSNEPNLVLCTIIASTLEKTIKKKRNIDGDVKCSLQKSCHNDLYSCIKNVTQKKPSLRWLPVFRLALQYHLNPKNINIDEKAQEKLIQLLPDYTNIIMDRVRSADVSENDGNDDESDSDYENNSNNFEEEANILMLVIQNRSKLQSTLPDDLISTSWIKMASHLPVQKLQIFLQAASNDEFKSILQNLTILTTQLLKDSTVERKLCLLWKVLLMAQLGCEKAVLRNNIIDHLSSTFLQLAFQWRDSGNIMNIHGLLLTLITALKVKMTIHHVEMCLEVITSTPSGASPKLVNKAIGVLSAILRYRMALIIDLIPQFLQRLIYIISIIAAASHNNSLHPVSKFADCAFSMEKGGESILQMPKQCRGH